MPRSSALLLFLLAASCKTPERTSTTTSTSAQRERNHWLGLPRPR